MKPEFRRVRQTVYALKRAYGQGLVLCRTTANSIDLKVGKMTATLIKATIRRAVVLPSRGLRDFSYDLSFIAANKNFTYGGLYDHKTRKLLIDRRDVPSDFIVDLNMHLIFADKRYEVKELHEYEEYECLVLVIDALSGAPIQEQHDATIAQALGLSDQADGVKP